MHFDVASVVVAYVDTSGHFFVEASDYVVSFWFGYVVFRMEEQGGWACVKTTCRFFIKNENGIYDRRLYGLRVKKREARL